MVQKLESWVMDLGHSTPKQTDYLIRRNEASIQELLETSLYSNNTFNLTRLDAQKDFIIQWFRGIMRACGYTEQEPVDITSGIDDTVLFIGSHISVLKQFFLAGNYKWWEWIFMTQPCFRWRNIHWLYDDDKSIRWWSYFPSIGSISKPWEIKSTTAILLNYLISVLKIDPDNIILRVSSKDIDLIEAINAYNGPKVTVELDSKDPKYYTHEIGFDKIKWRNFNVALRHGKTNTFNDVWNLIVIEDDERNYGVEIALGVTTILMEVNWLNDNLQVSKVSYVIPNSDRLHTKLKDCIVSSVVLLREDERPIATNKWRVLRKYLRWLLYFRVKLGYSNEQIAWFVKDYEYLEYWNDSDVWRVVLNYLNFYENQLRTKNNLSDEDKMLKSLII